MKRKVIRNQAYINLLLWIVILVMLNFISSWFFTRIDLTSEKRYTLSDNTVKMLENLDDVVFFKVYLEGDLNSGFTRLQNSVKEMLDEFRVYAGSNIEYEFIDPFNSKDEKTRNEIGRQLMQKGLMPTNLQEEDDEGKMSQKIIFPGALVSYRGKEIAAGLLENNMNMSAEENLNNSMQDIEYKLVKALRDCDMVEKPRIAILEGHGELHDYQLYDVFNALSEFYGVEFLKLGGKLNALRERIQIDSTKTKVVNRYNAIIIAGPDSAFNKYDKFIIDQFIMNGGRVMWLVEGTTMDMDSLAYQMASMALVKEINIEDMLFRYGVRVNPDLIQDLQCGVIPINTSVVGAEPRFEPFPWLYFPLIASTNDHPINRNMDLLKTEFVSSLDTVGENPNIRKTILLRTSANSKVVAVPARVSLELVSTRPDKDQFIRSSVPVAVLLEGRFESLFRNRLEPEFEEDDLIGFVEESVPTRMIVVSDADIIKNYYQKQGGEYYALPLGADKWFDKVFYGGNKEFIMNSMNYLCDDSGIMSVRSRELKMRLLDRARAKDERFLWQAVNLLIPVIVILLAGFVILFIRKRKYAIRLK